MQCPSCRFENIPGLTSCGRCGSVLDFNAIAFDVHPPRASHASKVLRRWFPRRRVYQARDLAVATLERTGGTFINDLRVPLPEPEIAPRLIVPGWAHLRMDLRIRGWAYLGGYLVLLALGILNWGNSAGAMALGLAFSIHISSILDILIRQGSVRFPSLVATSALVALALGLGVYAPTGWILSGVAATRQYDHNAPPFERLDVLVFNRWAFSRRLPRPGDVVLFHPGELPPIPSEMSIPHTRWMLRENECVDRVLGGPGDHVVWRSGKLTVNGTAVNWAPLIASKLPEELVFDVPRGFYLILPTTAIGVTGGFPAIAWQPFSLHRAEEIEGRVYLRLRMLDWPWFIR